MAFSHVPLRRSIPAGVAAYLAGYAAAFALVGSRTAAMLESIRIEVPYSDPVALSSVVDAAIPTWKAVGWALHSAHGVNLVVPLLDYAKTATLNVLARAGGEYRLLYLVPPVLLVVTGYLVARTSRTYGARGEQFAGASVALGYLPACIVGGLLYSVGMASISPNLVTTILVAGLGYPVVFGWLGGLAARWQSEREAETAGVGEGSD